MPIVRIKKRDNPFVQIDKRAINNSALSWKAKGLLTYLISKPNNWKVKIEDLQKHSSDGRASCRSGLQELESNGYITKNRIRNKAGVFTDIEYLVSEVPKDGYKSQKSAFKANQSTNGKPDCGFEKSAFKENEATNGFSTDGKPTRGKSNTTNIDSSNKELSNNKNTTTNYPLSQNVEKIIQAWNSTFEVVVDVSDKTLLNHIEKALKKFSTEQILQAIEFRSKASFYKEEYSHLRDHPKSFFLFPQTIRNDMHRYPYKLISYKRKCELEQLGTDKRFEKDPDETDNLGQPKWRAYG